MEQRVAEIEGRIASRLKDLRTRQELTLDELSRRSGVSRSMISLIERAESSPTASVLDKLAASLGRTRREAEGSARMARPGERVHKAQLVPAGLSFSYRARRGRAALRHAGRL